MPLEFSNTIRALLTISLLMASNADAAGIKARRYFEAPLEVALLEAAANGDVARMDRLVSAGADVNAIGRDGMTAAFWAISHTSKSGFAYLLEHGANPNLAYGPDGNSATSLAAMAEDPWYLNEVLTHQGDANLVNSRSLRTPIIDAILAARDANIKILIAARANLDALDRTGCTPAMVAAGIWRFDYVYQLLVAGANPGIQTAKGDSLALRVGRSPIPPANPRYEWKVRVVEFLETKGIHVRDASAGSPNYQLERP